MAVKELNAEYFFSRLGISQGFFIDVGANDGVTGSMSFPLEKSGWKGFMVEPNPLLVQQIKKVRSNPVYQRAIAREKGEFEFYVVEGPGNLHGLSRLSISAEFEAHVKNHHGKIIKHQVQCTTLRDLLLENSYNGPIDFLKVDVEGHELDVFKGIDLAEIHPRVIVAEDNTKDKNKEVRHYLKQFGYEVVARSGTNNWYVQKDDKNLFWGLMWYARWTFLRWDLKRSLFRFFGKEFKSNYI